MPAPDREPLVPTGRVGYSPPGLTGVFDVLKVPTERRPDAAALIIDAERTRVTFAQLDQLATDVSDELVARGLRPGDRIALLAPNGLEFVVALLAAAKANLVTVTLNPAVSTDEVAQRMAEARARILLGVPSLGQEPPDALAAKALPIWTIDVDTTSGPQFALTVKADAPPTAAARDDRPLPDSDPDDALIMFTSGTTARPKRVPLTHTNIAASVRGICTTYELGPSDATVAVMPFFHGHGLMAGLLSTLATGGCVLIPAAGRFSARSLWDDVAAVSATWITAVPTMYRILLSRAATDYPGRDRCPLRFLRSCSAPLDSPTATAMSRTFHAPVLSAYGMTETTHQAAAQALPTHCAGRPGSVGHATGTIIRVVDPHGKDTAVGNSGEVWVSGPTVARGYLENPTESARSFTDGWFHSGDLGTLDAEGTLTITGRIKELINRGGEKISPVQVEAVLNACPGVTEAAVFGVSDEKYGERVEAAVVAEVGVSTADLLSACRKHLAPFEIPDSIQFVSELPHTPKGALDRRAVTARFGG